MGSSIKQGQSIFIPFVNGESVPDSQNRPRMYKTVEQYKKNSRVFHGELPILIEYVPEKVKEQPDIPEDEELLESAKKIKEYCMKAEVGGHCPFGKSNTCLGAHDCMLSGIDEPSPAEDWYVPTKEETMSKDCRKPLTMEELRNMEGDPVFHKKTGKWYTIAINSYYGDCILKDGRLYFLPLEIAAKDGLYTVQILHIERSAWEPCENCGLKCRVCFRNGTDRCKKCKNYDLYIPVAHFCQCCGRPLTDAAWDMLERRLAEHDKR